MPDNPFAIPQSMREASQRNLEQAHAVYEQVMDFMTKAMDAWMGALPENPMTAGFKDVQSRLMEFAKENAEASFTLAGKISNAPTERLKRGPVRRIVWERAALPCRAGALALA